MLLQGFSCGFLPESIWFKKENNLNFEGKEFDVIKEFRSQLLEGWRYSC
jgi:hypothetical protein